MRFARGIFNNRKALCLYGCKDNIHRCTDGDHVKVNVRTAQLLCGDLDHAVVEAVRAAQRLKALDVLVNGAHAEIAAAGKRHNGLGAAAEQSADIVVRAAHFAAQLARHHVRVDGGRVDLHGILAEPAHSRTHLGQDACTELHIGNVRYVLYTAGRFRHGYGRNDRHSRVFRAADDNLTVQALSALDDKFIHCNFPFCGRGISSAVKGTLPAATQRRNALHEVGSFVMPAGP